MHVAYRLIDAACVRKLITKFGGRATRLLSGRRAFRYLVRYKWPQRRGSTCTTFARMWELGNHSNHVFDSPVAIETAKNTSVWPRVHGRRHLGKGQRRV